MSGNGSAAPVPDPLVRAASDQPRGALTLRRAKICRSWRSEDGLSVEAPLMADVVNINDVLDRHVVLDLQCVDRIYLNAYVPNLQVGGQVVTFLTAHLGNDIPSPALFKQLGERFRKQVKA